jgi:hypothetical protein
MRIRVRLPKVEPGQYSLPNECPYEGCDGQFFKPHGVKGEEKAIRDLRYEEVKSYRYRCLRCERTFRVYPQGVKRNVDSWAQSVIEQQKKNESLPKGVKSSTERLREDVQTIQQLVRKRPPDATDTLEKMYYRYMAAPVPKKGERHTIWYRMRMRITRLWENWHRLTLDQRRDDLDGTNNSSERLIGWWIKERYRMMRGYKRTESIRNVVTLTARIGVRSGRYDMSELYA